MLPGGEIGTTRVRFGGEDWLHLLGCTNSQTNNCLILTDEVPLLNVGVWCAVSATAVHTSMSVKPSTRLHIVHTF
jgi:hypothetical protein